MKFVFLYSLTLVSFLGPLGSSSAWAFVGAILTKNAASSTGSETKPVKMSVTKSISQAALANFDKKTTLTLKIKSFKTKTSPSLTRNEQTLVMPIASDVKDLRMGRPTPESFSQLQTWTSPMAISVEESDPCSHTRFFQKPGSKSSKMESENSKLGNTKAAAVKLVNEKSAKMKPAKLTIQNSDGDSDVILFDDNDLENPWVINHSPFVLLTKEESAGVLNSLRKRGFDIKENSPIENTLNLYAQKGFLFILIPLSTELSNDATELVQISFTSTRWSLPIGFPSGLSLGFSKSDNHDPASSLTLYVLSPEGKTQISNISSLHPPTQVDLPPEVKNSFSDIYSAIRIQSLKTQKEPLSALIESAGPTQWCSPCSTEPLSKNELQNLGVPATQTENSYVTRFHFSQDYEDSNEGFSEGFADLNFHTSMDRQPFGAIYYLRSKWKGGSTCQAAKDYLSMVRSRENQEMQSLKNLTGWQESKIKSTITASLRQPNNSNQQLKNEASSDKKNLPWYKRIWR